MKMAGLVFVILCCGLALGPLVWHGVSSLKTPAEIVRLPPTLIPENPTADNFVELFARRPFARYALNSLVISALASAVCVFAGSMAAYRLARSPRRLRSTVTGALLGLALFPPIVFLLPLYEFVRTLGLVNHPWALIVPYAGLNLPLAVWLLTGYFEQIPTEIEEAAAIDGLSQFQTFVRIVLPLSMPALVTTLVLVFVFSWNEFMLALTFMNAESARTLTVGVTTISGAGAYEIPYGLLAAGVVASSAPLIVLVLIFQRRIVAGLTAGSIK
jgi:multiple sugar transport system permease protein